MPNPAIEGVEGCVPILMRVKTGEDRDELLKVIESKQEWTHVTFLSHPFI